MQSLKVRSTVAVRPSRRSTVSVRALQLPQGVPAPRREPKLPKSTFGFVDNAERLNSRAAMIGFFALLLVEGVTGKGLLQLIGFEVGKGIGFTL